jgi:hypothetical protein
VVLGTSNYSQKIATLLEDKAHAKLEKDPMESMECKTDLHLKKSPVSEEVCQQL